MNNRRNFLKQATINGRTFKTGQKIDLFLITKHCKNSAWLKDGKLSRIKSSDQLNNITYTHFLRYSNLDHRNGRLSMLLMLDNSTDLYEVVNLELYSLTVS